MRSSLFLLSVLCFLLVIELPAQVEPDTTINKASLKKTDTARRASLDSFILRQRGLFGKLARNLLSNNPTGDPVTGPIRNDLLFSIYNGRVIRSINVEVLDFGTAIADTSRRFKSKLTNLANSFHHKTRNHVIRNNLFFQVGDKVSPYLLADNERHLRDQPYMQDARIVIRSSDRSFDSVDVTIFTKDVLSIGGSFRMRNSTSVSGTLREDNLGGWGDRLQGSLLYDQRRKERVGYGAEYIKRNIGGSFIDGYIGFDNFNRAFNSGRNEEMTYYARLIRPLVHPYLRFTYAGEVAYHRTENMYLGDSVYKTDAQYEYYNYDTWIGWNTGAYKVGNVQNENDRLRTLLSMRFFRKQFQQVPDVFSQEYYYDYIDRTAALAALSIFRQDFYKVRYVYGFGRNEDVPEGMDLSFTAGYTQTQGRDRPYAGIDFQRFFFTEKEHYFNYTARVGGYFNKKVIEDVDVLFNLDYFSNLKTLSKNWKQRTFISAGFTLQANKELNEPLFLESPFGLPELRNNKRVYGEIRSTLKGESVFFSPWMFLNFRFAPFIFGNLTLLTPEKQELKKSDLYSSIGGGLRSRNESLIFGTLEFKAFFFPRQNYFGDRWRFEFNTNVKFKYNRQFIKRPELILAN
ncbi:hypothetical protein [Paraflavitalea pollutisoli]|uniref:hypothetical protein n=1 Tax=Paraflavitalea pollutisoli TaxID=3034143 RepID=UPI0023EC8CFF|nr:hypothetical protein [Paraflavitalea sp. H1-2-19X]